MASARENIMQRIRRANRCGADNLEQELIERRLQQHSRGPQPKWSQQLVDRFREKAEQSAASVSAVQSEQDIVTSVSDYLAQHALGNRLLCAGTELIGALDWPENMLVETRAATVNDRVVLVEAFAAIAETGSIVMCSGKQTPVSLNFLPDHFLCVLHQSRITATIEDLWEKMRRERISMPRTLNIISGPSRTADVEQVIQLGAHGPRKVHLLLLESNQ